MRDIVEPKDAMSAVMRMKHEIEEEPLEFRGRLRVWLNGKLVNDHENLIVNAGHNMLAHRFWGQSSPPGAISHVAIGTGNTAAANTQTALVSEVHRNANATFTRANNVLTVTASFGDGDGEGLIAEAGLFNASSGGTMFARSLLSPARQKNTADTIDITWDLTF